MYTSIYFDIFKHFLGVSFTNIHFSFTYQKKKKKERVLLIFISNMVQVPQFLLDYMWSKGEACKIVCTQPRRISATSGVHSLP